MIQNFVMLVYCATVAAVLVFAVATFSAARAQAADPKSVFGDPRVQDDARIHPVSRLQRRHAP